VKSVFAFSCTLIALAAGNVAAAGPFDQGWHYPLSVQAQSPQPEPQRDAARPVPQRDTRGVGEADRSRMNPDERRQLRRDIQDAGKDIYRPAQPGRGDGRRPAHR
jgi:hypothetical protein